MNIHARNPSYKLTMVSIYHRGFKHVEFVSLPLLDNKPVLSRSTLNKILDKLNVGIGDTWSIGY